VTCGETGLIFFHFSNSYKNCNNFEERKRIFLSQLDTKRNPSEGFFQRSQRTPIFVPYGIKSFDLIMINLKMKYDKHFTFKNGWETIMINNSSLRKWDRLAKKQLNQQFLNEIIQGLNCSSFEASAILETVHKVYAPYFVPKGSPRENKWSFKAWSNTFPGGFY